MDSLRHSSPLTHSDVLSCVAGHVLGSRLRDASRLGRVCVQSALGEVRRGQTPNRPPLTRRPVQCALDHQRRLGCQRTHGQAWRDVPRSPQGRRGPWWSTSSSNWRPAPRWSSRGWASCTVRKTSRSASWPMPSLSACFSRLATPAFRLWHARSLHQNQ